jgi:phosphoesterase RecJ-like protein
MSTGAAQTVLSYLGSISSPKIIITTHHKPDADAMGSSLGLYHFLTYLGFHPTVISPTDFAHNLNWMPKADLVINYEEKTEECKHLVQEADLIFCLDFNDLSRINEMGEDVKLSKAKTVLIDHHQYPSNFEDFTYWDDTASSTCELVYRFMQDLNQTHLVDAPIATCLYTGIMADTGSFKYSNCSGSTHRTIADLIDKGANHVDINDRFYDNFSEQRVRFIGYAISEKMEVLKGLNTALIVINREELERFHLTTGDTEGLVNYGLSIAGVKFAVLIIDRTKMVKMSFRSKGNFGVNLFAKTYFNGGGHFYAAGGSSMDTLEQTVARFKQELIKYKEELNA